MFPPDPGAFNWISLTSPLPLLRPNTMFSLNKREHFNQEVNFIDSLYLKSRCEQMFALHPLTVNNCATACNPP